eukprot:symbB.v1.2.017220.t1/scaffold1333.1/size124786/6
MSRSGSQLLSAALLALLAICAWVPAFISSKAQVPTAVAAAAAAAAVPLPALAGEPPSVGIHWYWDLGIGTLHGETASIVMLVVFLTVIFALLGAGGLSVADIYRPRSFMEVENYRCTIWPCPLSRLIMQKDDISCAEEKPLGRMSSFAPTSRALDSNSTNLSVKMSRSGSQLLSVALLALLAICAWVPAFISSKAQVPTAVAAAAAAAAVPLPALAGEPPSVGIHWYWDLGIGTLHGETASIVMLVVFLTVIFALLGAGGQRKQLFIVKMARSGSQLLSAALLALLAICAWVPAFISSKAQVPTAVAAAAAAAAVPLPALAGEPPSVGIHWYWDLGIGTLHGETASIVMLVVFLTVIFALLGAGGSTRKA